MLKHLRTLLGHTVVYGLGNYGIKIVGFLLIPVYTRYLDPKDYGIMALVSMYTQGMFVFMNLGQNTAIFRFYYDHDDPEWRERVIAAALWIVFLVAVPLACVPLFFSRPLAVKLLDDGRLWFLVAIGTGTVLAKVLLRMPFTIMRAKEYSKRYASWSLLRGTLATTLAVILVVGFHLRATGVVLSQFLGEFVMCLLLTGATFRMLRVGFRWDDIREQLAFGLPLVPAGVATFALHLADRWFIRTYYTVADVGIYSLAFRFGEILLFVVTAVQLSWGPFIFSRRLDPEAPPIFARVTSYFVAIYLFLWLGLAAFAPELIRVMAPAKYAASAGLIPLLGFALLTRGLMPMVNIGPAFAKRTILRSYTVTTAAVVNVVLNYLLIPRLGPMGAAWAALGGASVQLGMATAISLHLYPVPYEWRRLALVLFAALGLYGATVWTTVESALGGFALKAGLVALYPALVLFSGFFDADDLTRALGWAGRRVPQATPAVRVLAAVLRVPPPEAGGR